MKLKSMIAAAALTLLSGTAANAGDLNIYTGLTAAVSTGTFIKSTTAMTEVSDGVFSGTVVLDNTSGYYFTFGVPGQYGSYTMYSAPQVSGGTSLSIAAGATATANLVSSSGQSGSCWYWADSKDEEGITQNIGVVELEARVDLNNMTATFTNNSEPTVTDPVPNRLVLQIGRYQSVSKMRTGNTVAPTINGNTLEYSFILTPDAGYYFCFYNEANYTDLGPGTTTPVGLNLAKDQSYTGSVAYGDNSNGNCWFWPGQDGEQEFKAVVNWATKTVTITYLGEYVPFVPDKTYTISLDFKADNFVLGNYLANYVDITDLRTDETLDLTSNPLEYTYWQIPSGLNFAARPGYELAIESSNPALEGEGYTITGNSMMADDDVLDFGTQTVLSLFEKADGLTFTATLKRVPQENLPNELYVMIGATGTTLNSQLKPGDNDPYLVFNPNTQCYEGTISLRKTRFKFYSPQDNGNYTVFGQNGTEGDGFISFGRDLLPYEGEGGWDASSCWYLTSSFNNATTMDVRMVVDVINNKVTFYPVLPKAPAQIYIWGSKEGGFNPASFSYFATVKASAENPNIFTAEIDVPYVGEGVYTDPDTGVNMPFEGWAFKYCVNRDYCNSGTFGAQEGYNTIDFSKMISFNTVMNGYSQLYSLSSGKMTFTFNWETLELVVTNNETPSTFNVTLDFEGEGIDLTSVNDYVSVFDLMADGVELDINANPFTYSYSSSMAALSFGAQEGYQIALECTNYDGEPGTPDCPFQIQNASPMADNLLDFGSQIQLGLTPAANGLNFKVTVQPVPVEIPAPTVIVPLGGEAKLLYNSFEITWGYNKLEDNSGDNPIQVNLTFPDGTQKTVKGQITDANGVETGDVESMPSDVDNALVFRNFMAVDPDSSQLIQQNGTYKISVPAGIVLVNGTPNPAAELSFIITGESGETPEYLNTAELVIPGNYYLSYLSSVQVTWNEEVTFANGEESVELNVDIDGVPGKVTAQIMTVQDSGENDDTVTDIDVLYISFDDFLMYSSTSFVDIVIPEGLVKNAEGEINPQQTLSFYLYEGLVGSTDPESGSELSGEAKVTISWEGLEVQPCSGSIVARGINGTEGTVTLKPVFNENASITLDLSSLSAGKYEIIVPEAYVFVIQEGDVTAINQEMYPEFTIVDTGVAHGADFIDAEDGIFEVYNLQGIRVLRTEDRNALKSLTPGMYIINRKAVLVK